jgi:hypothetical protein
MFKNISAWTLLAVSAILAPASNTIPQNSPETTINQVEESKTTLAKYTQPPVVAPATAKVAFDKPKVTSIPAPPKPKPKPVVKVEKKETATAPIAVTKQGSPVATTTNETETAPAIGITDQESPATSVAKSPQSVSFTPGSAKDEAAKQMKAYGWEADQLTCLISLWEKESNWNWTAENPSSGAYGIPQSLPGNKMASAGADWRTNPATQIKWGLGYIAERYKTPCGAWGHSIAVGWY